MNLMYLNLLVKIIYVFLVMQLMQFQVLVKIHFEKKIEIGGAHTPNTWLLDDNDLTYDSQLYYCGDAPPFHITTDASTYPGNEGGDICNEIVSFETVPYQEPPPENTVDPAEPMEVKGKLGEDDVTLSANGQRYCWRRRHCFVYY